MVNNNIILLIFEVFMNFFEKLIYIISSTMEKPSDYGWFHLFFFILFAVITFVICFFYKDASHKTFKIISIICLCIMIFLETYKQIVLSCSFINNNIVWNYNWYNFPFQLCSSPLYILPFVIFIKKATYYRNIYFFSSNF